MGRAINLTMTRGNRHTFLYLTPQSGKTHDPSDFSTRCKKPAIPMFPKGDGFSVVAPSGIDPLT